MTEPGCERLLVTGGSGFVGTALVRALRLAGCVVTVADRVACSVPGTPTVLGDLQDERNRARCFESKIQGVIHLAAATSVLGSMRDPLGTFTNNVAVTAHLLDEARNHGVERFMLASTNAVVGDVGHDVIHERVPLHPLTPYGATKAAAEMLVSAYDAAYEVPACSLRLTNVYGPGMRLKDSFIARLMRAAAADTGVQIYGDGTQCRDFVHVDDVAAAFLLGLRQGLTGTFVVGSGTSVTMLDLVERVRAVTGRSIPVEHVSARPGEMAAVIVDITKAQGVGYEPSIELDEGLASVWRDAQGGWLEPTS